MIPTTAELAAALIAFGHTKDVGPEQTITHEGAVHLFSLDVAPLLGDVLGRPVLEAAALASFGFNCGRARLRKVLEGQDTIVNPVHTTDRHGKPLAGLVSRRRLEDILISLSNQTQP